MLENEYNLAHIVLGYEYNIALNEEGKMFGWGNNMFGQLGDGTTDHRYHIVAIMPSKRFKSISAGDGYSLAIDEDGFAYGWGNNFTGALGDLISPRTPKILIPGVKFKFISAGFSQSLLIAEDGEQYKLGDE